MQAGRFHSSFLEKPENRLGPAWGRGAALAALATVLAHQAQSQVVISQVYGGGGNSGATLRRDFIELLNTGTAPVSVTGWSVQYASSSGSSWQRTELSGTLPPGGYYLVWEAQGSGGSEDLPAADATGSIAMSSSSGKVALVASAAALSGTCPTGVVDFVGYGSANCFEGAGGTGSLSNTAAALRLLAGCTDTQDNGLDFLTGAPAPRNSAASPADCSAEPPPPPPPSTIAQIQGASHVSPLADENVNGVEGIVTALRSNGFFLQDPVGDGNPATSEGIFVYTVSAPGVSVGDAVSVDGRVQEFRPGGSGGLANLSITEIVSPRVTLLASGQALPPALLVGTGGRVPPASVIDDDAAGDVETSGTFDPETDGLDFWESLEGMRLRIPDPHVVGPTSNFGEFAIVGERGAQAGIFTPRGGLKLQPGDANPERLLVDDALMATLQVKVGDHFAGDIEGILDYSFGAPKLLATAIPEVLDGGLEPEVAEDCLIVKRRCKKGEVKEIVKRRGHPLRIATFNVENLDPSDPAEKFAALAQGIVEGLQSPSIIALEEMQDDNGPVNDAVTAAGQTAAQLIAAIVAAGGPEYRYVDIAPQPLQDGGEPGGNIRVGFLFAEGHGLSFVDRPGADAVTPNAVVSRRRGPQLQYSPGRLDPLNPAFANSRKPLAAEFRWRGEPLFLIADHFNSKGGDHPLMGRFQPPVRSSEVQRHAQAGVVADFARAVLELDPDAWVVVLGDINDFEDSETASILAEAGLTSLMNTLPLEERYSYVYEGNSQTLDQILVSPALLAKSPEVDVVHRNAEFPSPVSDHDPQVMCLERR